MPNPHHPEGFAVGNVLTGQQGSHAGLIVTAINLWDQAMLKDGGCFPTYDKLQLHHLTSDNILVNLTVFANFLCNEEHRKKDGTPYSPDTLRKYFNAVVQNMKHRCSQAKLQFGPDNETLSKMAYHLHKLASYRTQEGLEPDNLSNLKPLPLFGTLGFIHGHHLDPSKTLFGEGATATAPLTVLEQNDSLFTINDCLLKSHALKAASMRVQ